MINCFYPENQRERYAENIKYFASPTLLNEAAQNNLILEARVISCDAQHNLHLDLGCMRGIIPRSQGALGIDSGKVRDIALISRVGKSVCFTVEKICYADNAKPYALLSRSKAQQLCMDNFISRLCPGKIIDATITHLDSFGAFCDIGCGIIALLPIDAISVSRIAHPKDRFYAGQNIKVAIKSVTADGRITLTHKELLGTWEQNVAELCAGQTVSGIVRTIEDYGIFIELAPNLAGLAEPKDNVFAGETASVYIKSIIPEKMKIKLIIIDSFDTPSPQRINYFINSGHIDCWRYSPDVCEKVIETDFSTF